MSLHACSWWYEDAKTHHTSILSAKLLCLTVPALFLCDTLIACSWWYEDAETSDLTLRVSSASEAGGGLRRYYCTVQFDVARQTFSLRTSTDDQELAYGPIHAVTSSSSTTVELWDLHVGATVVILGKRVTLLKADLETVEWNRYHAQRLQKLKKELEVGACMRGHTHTHTHTRWFGIRHVSLLAQSSQAPRFSCCPSKSCYASMCSIVCVCVCGSFCVRSGRCRSTSPAHTPTPSRVSGAATAQLASCH